MFRSMRRSRQALTAEQTEQILKRNTSGVLAVRGDEGWPYAVPLSYVYTEGRIYFHCAKAGHKLDAIAREERVSFCVIDRDEIVPEKYTTYFRSAIVFGRAQVVEDEAERRAALSAIAAKYAPGDPEGREKEAADSLSRVCLLRLTPEYMSGKEAIELVRAREKGTAPTG